MVVNRGGRRLAGRGQALATEARLVRDLRSALPAEAQAMFFRQLDDLLALLEEPRCAECQADGVPCPHLGQACDDCGRAAAWVRDLREAIARSAT